MVAASVTLTLITAGLGVVTTSTAQAVSDTSNEIHPAVAVDPSTSNFFVVAESDDGRVYGTRVSPSGSPLDAPIALSPSGATATTPTVAWDGGGFVVAWEEAVSGCAHDIRAARITSTGALAQTGIQLSACADDQTRPQVTRGGTGAAVVWDVATGGIQSTVIDSTGGVGSVVDVSATGQDPAVAWNGAEYLVVWTQSGDIEGRRLSPSGGLAAPAFGVWVNANTKVEPAVASNGTEWLATWTELTSSYDVWGMRVDATGAPTGDQIPISDEVRDQGSQSVSFDGTNYLVVWNDSRADASGATYDIYASRIDPDGGGVVDPSGVVVSANPSQQGSPAVAWNGSLHLAVWQDNRNGPTKIFGARVDAAAAVAPGDFPIFPTTTGPALEIGDVKIVEGNTGTTQIAQIPLTLSRPAATSVTASYTLTGDSAQSPSDWRPTTILPSGTVTFPIGAVSMTVKAKINGDNTSGESDETLHATVTTVNGAHLEGDDTGTVTILDDDAGPALGVSVGDVVMPEGDTLTRSAKVPITLSAAVASDVTVTVTRRGTAVRLTDDKTPATKTLVIRAGTTVATMAVPVVGDSLRERDETVTLTASSLALPIARGTGTVTIRDASRDAGPAAASVPAGDAFYTPPVIAAGPPGELVWSRVTATTAAATEYLVMYRSTGQRGSAIFVTGRVWVPTVSTPAGGRNVVAWADGATGLGDECAPSRIPNGVAALNELLAAGNVVVGTDYEGSGTPGPHAFVMARSESQSVLDSIRVVAELGVPTSGRAVLLGASRGGHAVIATAERSGGYAPETQLLGAITLGPGVIAPTDDILIDGSLTSAGKGYTMMSIRAMQQIYGPTASAVKSYLSYYLTAAGIAELPNADSCATAVSHFAPISGATIFNLTRPTIPPDANVLRQELTIGAIGTSVPIMVMYGGIDDLVPPSAIDAWHAYACGQSGTIEKRLYPFSGHVPVPIADITAWIADRFAGAPAGTSCS